MVQGHNYNQSTQDRAGDIVCGLRVETSVLSTLATYWTNPVTFSIFDVVGRIKVHALYLEVTAALDANASTLAFRWTGTTPTLAIADIGAASASIATSAIGDRIMWLGVSSVTQVAAGPSAGISYLAEPVDLGYESGASPPVNGVGLISALIAGGTQAGTASGRYVIHYTPLSEGAYVESAI